EMDSRADGGSSQKEDQKAQRTEPARNGRAKSEQPDSIETQMHEAAVDECIGHERPDRGTPAKRPRVLPQYSQVVTSRHKGEHVQESTCLLGAEHELVDRMHESHGGQKQQHDEGNIEDRFAGWVHEFVPGERAEIGCAAAAGKATK